MTCCSRRRPKTLMTIAADPKHLGAPPSAPISVLHTWGSALTHHPHVHMIAPGGRPLARRSAEGGHEFFRGRDDGTAATRTHTCRKEAGPAGDPAGSERCCPSGGVQKGGRRVEKPNRSLETSALGRLRSARRSLKTPRFSTRNPRVGARGRLENLRRPLRRRIGI